MASADFHRYEQCGSTVFDNLALIFAIGVAVGLARADKGPAGLVAGLAYLVMNASINAMLSNTGQLAEDQLASAGQSSSKSSEITSRI